MASLSVAAIVVSHGQADLLAKSLEAIAGQSHPIEQVVVVETATDEVSIQIAKSFGFAVVTPGDIKLGAAIQSGVNSLAQVPGWLWIMHDDLVADSNALSQMARAAEISPSVAIIGPKLLEANDSIQIQQMGLTATKTGRPFLLVQREYDQGQHDKAGDTISVSTAGMLVSHGVWQQLGGLDDTTPPLAQDLEFGAKARVAGYRVIVEASAKMHHESLAMRGKRPKRWLGGSVKGALSKAHLHIATLMMPLPIVVLMYFALPAIVLGSIPFHLVAKQPSRIFSQLAAWLWAWLHLSQRFAARSRFRSLGNTKILNGLLATGKQLRARRKSRFEPEPEINLADQPPGIFRSNSGWFALLPLIAAIGLWPQGALTANGLLPLGESFSKVFASTGVDTQQYLQGVLAPSDPFTWFLALSAAISPSNPSLSFSAIVFAAPAIAFFGVWFLAKQIIGKAWVITLAALTYSLSPQLLLLVTAVSPIELLAASVLPWVAGFALRAFDAYNSARAWRWVGLTGLALAILASLSTLLFALIGLLVLSLSFARPRRLFILIWALVPGVALLYPWANFAIHTNSFELLTTSSAFAAAPQSLNLVDLIVLGLIALMAIASWFKVESARVAWLWVFAIVALAASWYQPIASSRPLVLASILALLLAAAAWLATTKAKVLKVTAASIGSGLALASVVVYGPLNQVDPAWSDTRVMPALVVAASELDAGVRTLVIDASDVISADYVWNSGLTLERVSISNNFISQDGEVAGQLAQAAGNLIAGNTEGFNQVTEELRVDFVLVKGSNTEVLTAVAAIEGLQPAGESEFGSLFRVENPATGTVAIDDGMRDYQLVILAIYGLLAIPTRASIRGYRRVKSGGKK